VLARKKVFKMSTTIPVVEEDEKAGFNEKGTASMLTGGALMVYGLLRRDLVGLLCTAGGAGMIAKTAAKKTAGTWAAVASQERMPLPLIGDRGTRKLKCKRSITISKIIEEIYEFLSNAANYSEFMHNVNKVEAESDSKWIWKVQNLAGSEMSWQTLVNKNEGGKEIVFSSAPDSDFGGTIRFALQPVHIARSVTAATVLQVELEYFRPNIGVVANIFHLLGQDPANQLEIDLAALKQLIESGEIATNRTN
jgi:uncharacterized membrane protein